VLVIKKKDNYNFILAEPLKEPIIKIVNFGGKEVEVKQTHKDKDLFYGTLTEAIIGLAKHSGKDISNLRDIIPKELSKVKPSSDLEPYSAFFEVGIAQIMQNYSKTYNV